jgi:hypothetical protein
MHRLEIRQHSWIIIDVLNGKRGDQELAQQLLRQCAILACRPTTLPRHMPGRSQKNRQTERFLQPEVFSADMGYLKTRRRPLSWTRLGRNHFGRDSASVISTPNTRWEYKLTSMMNRLKKVRSAAGHAHPILTRL